MLIKIIPYFATKIKSPKISRKSGKSVGKSGFYWIFFVSDVCSILKKNVR